MSIPRTRRVWLVAVVALMASLAVAAPAQAHSGGPPADANICYSSERVRSCFEKNGDDFWVKDLKADGRSAVVFWKYAGASDDTARSCRNTHGSGSWHECDFSMGEGRRIVWGHRTYDADTNTWWLDNSVAYPYDAVA